MKERYGLSKGVHSIINGSLHEKLSFSQKILAAVPELDYGQSRFVRIKKGGAN
jgi:hypothetical protein